MKRKITDKFYKTMFSPNKSTPSPRPCSVTTPFSLMLPEPSSEEQQQQEQQQQLQQLELPQSEQQQWQQQEQQQQQPESKCQQQTLKQPESELQAHHVLLELQHLQEQIKQQKLQQQQQQQQQRIQQQQQPREQFDKTPPRIRSNGASVLVGAGKFSISSELTVPGASCPSEILECYQDFEKAKQESLTSKERRGKEKRVEIGLRHLLKHMLTANSDSDHPSKLFVLQSSVVAICELNKQLQASTSVTADAEKFGLQSQLVELKESVRIMQDELTTLRFQNSQYQALLASFPPTTNLEHSIANLKQKISEQVPGASDLFLQRVREVLGSSNPASTFERQIYEDHKQPPDSNSDNLANQIPHQLAIILDQAPADTRADLERQIRDRMAANLEQRIISERVKMELSGRGRADSGPNLIPIHDRVMSIKNEEGPRAVSPRTSLSAALLSELQNAATMSFGTPPPQFRALGSRMSFSE